MRKIILSVSTGFVLIVISSVIIFAQTGITAYLRPVIVDVQQTVPIIADVAIPLDDGDIITATVPLTMNVSLQVSISGAISNSVKIVENTQPVIAVISPTATPTPKIASLTQREGQLTYEQLCVETPKELTNVKLKQYYETLIGTEVAWTGYVYDVIADRNGTYTIQISAKSKADSIIFSRNIEIMAVPENVAVDLDVEQPISYSGQIIAIEEFISNCNPVKIQYSSVSLR